MALALAEDRFCGQIIAIEKAIGINMYNTLSPSWSFDLNNCLLPHY
ncbi:hypothetical protein [Yersinia kristensenii]|nr:hypothetical protein [Yersinia kristensenii]